MGSSSSKELHLERGYSDTTSTLKDNAADLNFMSWQSSHRPIHCGRERQIESE
jgi:hypothetical protein